MIEGKPQFLDLRIGESGVVRTPHGPRSVKLVSVEHFWETDYWVPDNAERRTLRRAEVAVEVGGRGAVLIARPYQSPVEVHGLRLYVETTRLWAGGAFAAMPGFESDVRVSAVPAGASWGPRQLIFPVRNYRWRSASYNNTWSSLVPYNLLYYHRGEDYGAIPDRLEVQAPLDGEVTDSPVPAGDGASNGLAILCEGGLAIRMAHMNTETIDPKLTPRTRVQAGQVLGKTGSTWQGRRSQKNDPHLHVVFRVDGKEVSTFPYLVEAYFRTYPDAGLPIAGGYHFTEPGKRVEFDGSRSLARPGRRIASWMWRLQDGRTISDPVATVAYERPGLYSEELIIRTDDGQEDRDFAQVRVYDPTRRRDMVAGWAYHTPVRGIRPGVDVLFWCRLTNRRGPVTIDYGDGTPAEAIESEATHRYARPGLYVVSLRTVGPGDEPATVQMRVVVESE